MQPSIWGTLVESVSVSRAFAQHAQLNKKWLRKKKYSAKLMTAA
jgi:hypothetical protein